ncbi:ATP-binding cassette, subfamily G (WHITE), member 2, PDR [Marchantia polymorpha subsp. ruderalis]|uniref:ABC transporter domain-containing protein n=2 Tax=Marchantia polymorpha TaxID=3197 RepID=A0A176W2H0_MARPO|nr:hypothetical protein AXG93_473s1180 [Marchantia polymorpha subsp. ruderalis]PTQ28029.1 hypothetical protein MARPO_0176s0013 [Marchantia polymorpha]BBN19277.1 hypothetical protein Mp_8g09300 [Marchantia polymorpha subsp. ruderalis]|eukprot:PTQ28029.1 hypothetical protein MARPO_0176s0013 [Marchantia polymorpha]
MAASTGSNLQSIDLWSLGRSVSIGTNTGSRRSFGGSSRNWGVGPDNVFARDSESRRQPGDDDEEALKWAALEKLPTYDRLRTTILEQLGNKAAPTQLDVRLAGIEENQALLRNVFNMKSTEEDNEVFLTRLRNRIQRVDLQQPTQEVRYDHLTITADCYVGGRALPSLTNAARNTIEYVLNKIGIPVTKKTSVSILDDVSGIIRPGRMTLLLGPPGSGKTTLLLALAGRLDKSLKVDGKITYNGFDMKDFVPQKTAAYVSQHDLHIGEMTVRETLDFSARCQGVGERFDLLAELDRREKQRGLRADPDLDFFMKSTAAGTGSLITEYIMKILGLDICADTMVGDDMRRGISGGQKKRVTTGEMIVGPLRTLFMDEISTGLDSSTTFQIVKCLGDVAHVLDSTVMISLLQPAPETYNLFDDIVLLSEGKVVYHGPRENILEFFESCGYKCPERKGVADFLQEVTSRKDQEQYWADKRRPYQYTSVKDFADAFQEFYVGTEMARQLSIPFDKSKSHPQALSFKKYSVPYKDLLRFSFQKEVLLMKRNAFVSYFKAFQIAVMAFIAMTTFFRTEMSRDNLEDAQTYAGALFFGVVNILFNGFSELSMTIIRLPVFYKQRDLLFHPPWTFTLSKFLINIPTSVLESSIWVIITYYTVGFAPSAARFFRQLLLMFSVHSMASALFRLIAGICRTMVVANTGGSLALLVVFVLGGFLLPRTSIKPWWIWGYWISPLSYAQNAVDVNEFLAPQWNKPIPGINDSLGVTFLKSSGVFPRGRWFWIGVGVNLGYALLFNVLFTLAITYLNPLGRSQAVISEEVYNEKQAALTGVETPSMGEAQRVARSASGSVGQGSSISRRQPRSLSASASKVTSEIGMSRISSSSVSKRGASNSSMSRDSFEHGGEGTPSKRGMILPFEPLSISFDDVKYYVDMPAEMKAQGAGEDRLQLLKGVTGAFRPGVLTALVGVSGAGKSTLMDVLAGRKTGGYIEGDIRISGYPKKQATFARISGYCEQNDIHSPQVTVFESLVYSAWLRLDRNIEKETKELFVQQVMDLVELTTLRDALVGLPGVSGLSTEQRKRLTIAVELVANPSIIFMDEPTSGLDARAAAIVMRTVRNTVDTGRTVVCTIHQPSIDIFEAFDELLLMKRGGQVIYAGPLGRHSHKLVEYFEAIPGTPKIKEGYNPATWMLEVSSVSVENRLAVDFADIYSKSALFERNKALVHELSTPPEGAKDLWFASQFSQPFWTQTIACLWKQNITYWRSPSYNNVRFLFTILAALLFGTIFWRLGMERHKQSNIFSIMGSMLGAVLFIGINNASTVQPVVATERTVFYRERAAGMYSAFPYAIAQVLIEIPYCFAQVIVYSLITYSMINYEWTAAKFFWYIYFMFFTFLYFTFYGMMAVGLTPNHNIAAIVSAFFYSVFNLFSGFLIFKKRIPGWWIWYYWICPVAWTLYGLITSQFGDVTEDVLLTGGGTQRIKDFVNDTFGFKYDFLPVVAIMLLVFPCLFAFVFMVSIKFLNFQTR